MRRILASLMIIGLVAGAVAFGAASFVDTETSEDNTISTGSLDLKIAASDSEESPMTDPAGEEDDAFGDFSSATWVISNVTPGANVSCTPDPGNVECVGGDTVAGTVRLQRTGSITPNHLEVMADLTIDENYMESDTVGDSSPNEMARKLRLVDLEWNGNDCLDASDDGSPAFAYCLLSDSDGDGVLTLYDLTSANALDDVLPLPDTGPLGTGFAMRLRWAEDTAMPGLGYTANCGTAPRLCDNAFQGDTLHIDVMFTLQQ